MSEGRFTFHFASTLEDRSAILVSIMCTKPFHIKQIHITFVIFYGWGKQTGAAVVKYTQLSNIIGMCRVYVGKTSWLRSSQVLAVFSSTCFQPEHKESP